MFLFLHPSLCLSFCLLLSLSLSALKKVGKDNEGVGVSVVSRHLITLACNQLQGDVWPCQSLMCLQLRVRNYCWSTAPFPLLSLHLSVSNSRDCHGRGSMAREKPERAGWVGFRLWRPGSLACSSKKSRMAGLHLNLTLAFSVTRPDHLQLFSFSLDCFMGDAGEQMFW